MIRNVSLGFSAALLVALTACSSPEAAKTCLAGSADCGNGCADLDTDQLNCGACGNACGPGRVCAGGTCSLSCQAGLTNCGGTCRDLQTDPNNCGACGNATAFCFQGTSACVNVGGLHWCYNPTACGEPCDAMCASLGLGLALPDALWFSAQDSQAECQAINDAFGLGGTASFSSFTYACLEDTGGAHTAPGGLNGPLLCSSVAACPTSHRTNMDQLGVACGPGSRRSVCPCL